jgi:thioredoxin reductase (NADPH)
LPFFEGLLKLKCHILDALPQGGQLSELYPKSPSRYSWISEVLAGDLVGNDGTNKTIEPGFAW